MTNFDCEICSDKAGYFSYLPSLFYYDFKASNYPEKLDSLRGNGFHLNIERDKIITKFPIGVALMQSPFFISGYAFDNIFLLNNDPFSKYYLVWMSFGSSFYFVLSFFLYRKVLLRLYSQKTAFVTSILILIATHTLYYALDENLMSHLYSFFLLNALMYGALKIVETKKRKLLWVISAIFTLAVLVRPTNILFLPIVYFFTSIIYPKEIIPTLKSFRSSDFAEAILIGALVACPQILYWNYAYDEWFVWTYEGEGFTNALAPYFLEVWFSPQGGLFTYTPILFVALFSATIFFSKNKNLSLLVFATFLTVSYLCASWHTPFFGECNFGKRPFVEFLPVLFIPIGLLIENTKESNSLQKLIFSIFLFFIILNLTLFGVFDTCFFGTKWDWNSYLTLILKGFRMI